MRIVRWISLAALITVLSGCIVVPYDPYYGHDRGYHHHHDRD